MQIDNTNNTDTKSLQTFF